MQESDFFGQSTLGGYLSDVGRYRRFVPAKNVGTTTVQAGTVVCLAVGSGGLTFGLGVIGPSGILAEDTPPGEVG